MPNPQQMQLILICILSAATVCLFVIGITLRGERGIVQDRVESMRLSLQEDIEKIVPELTLPFVERVVKPGLRWWAKVFASLLPSNNAEVAEKLERAGRPWGLKPVEFVGLKVFSILVFAAAGLAFFFFVDEDMLNKLLVLILSVVIGYALPESLLAQAINERHRLIRKSLANSLDLLVVSAEAGLGFDGAVAKVVETTRGPLAEEFGRMLQDMSAGRSRLDALKSMSDRVGLPDLTTFVAAIRQATMLGTSVAQVLRVQADSLRVHRSLRAREAAAKLPVKMLFPLVICVFPAIMIVVLGPALIQVYQALGIGH
jgi:tight adherence protein C